MSGYNENYNKVKRILEENEVGINVQREERPQFELIIGNEEHDVNVHLFVEKGFCIIESYFLTKIDKSKFESIALYANLLNSILKDGKFFVQLEDNQFIFRTVYDFENDENQLIHNIYLSASMMISVIDSINKLLYSGGDYLELYNEKLDSVSGQMEKERNEEEGVSAN